MRQKWVLPGPGEPMIQAFRLRALAEILGRGVYDELLGAGKNDIVFKLWGDKGLDVHLNAPPDRAVGVQHAESNPHK